MQVLEGISNFLKTWCGGARMPQVEACAPTHTYTPDELEAFIDHSLNSQDRFAQSMLFANDMENMFARANIRSSLRIAQMNLSVFRAGLESSGHTGTCLWFETSETPQAIRFAGQVLDCSADERGEHLQVFHQGTKIGDVYAMHGWVGPTPKVIGWLAMIDIQKVNVTSLA
jgi:hypothetical protein